MPKPADWNNKYNAAYSYYIYYLFANLYVLNHFRQSRGLNTFTFRCARPRLPRIFSRAAPVPRPRSGHVGVLDGSDSECASLGARLGGCWRRGPWRAALLTCGVAAGHTVGKRASWTTWRAPSWCATTSRTASTSASPRCCSTSTTSPRYAAWPAPPPCRRAGERSCPQRCAAAVPTAPEVISPYVYTISLKAARAGA